MTTKTDVINEALGMLGLPPSANPSADSQSWVRRILARYNPTVRLLLEDHPWNFPATRVALERLAITPIGRAYAYNKPADCLRINMVNNTGSTADDEVPDYDDEGGQILADMDPCYLFYISSTWLTKEGSWPQKFARAVSAELAALNAEVATKSAQKGVTLEERAEAALKKAKTWDASQKPWRRLPGGLWAGARRNGMRYRTNG